MLSRHRWVDWLICGLFALALGGATCRPIVDDPSAFALESGDATMVLGACGRPLVSGYDACQLTRGAKMPTLRLFFTNSGDYAVSDCSLGLFKTGAVANPGMVEIDLSPLTDQATKAGFCLLKIEAVERFPDPRDPTQHHQIPLAGGFFVEFFEPGYLPEPAPDVVSWRCVVERTVKGRTKVSCK